MRWKIVIKLLYLVALFVIAATQGKNDTQLIDSNPTEEKTSVYHASLKK